MAIRFITNSRVGMQRPGLLAAAIVTASDRQSTDLDRSASRLLKVVSKRRDVPVDVSPDVERYLSGLRLWKRYGHLKGRGLAREDLVEVQDLWLADPSIPRATGAVTPENASELPQLAVSLRLLRDRNYTRTDRGRALLAALGDRRSSIEHGDVAPNPLELGFTAQLLIAAALLEADGDFLQSAWRTAAVFDEEDTFTRVDFASGMKAACDDLVARSRRGARTGADRRTVIRLKDWADAVDKPRGSGKEWGGGRPPDQLATVRIEPWVDLGLFTADDRFIYRYRVTDGQRQAVTTIANADDVRELTSRSLVALMHNAHGRSVPPRASDNEAWDAIRAAYGELRTRLGFAAFAEVVLLAAGRLADAPDPRLLELQQGVELLQERRRDAPKDVRIGINRGGELTYMKLSEAVRSP
jgi:hypothetical protein